MKIGKPLIVFLTPIGVIAGIYEGYRLAGGLVFLMLAMLALISVAVGTVVATIRREKAAERAAEAARAAGTAPEPGSSPDR